MTLPPRLAEVLDGITDRELSSRLDRVLHAAARAMDRLSHLNLLRFEPQGFDEGSADLALWEQMAPAIRDTVVDVNALIDVIFLEFPQSQAAQRYAHDASDDGASLGVGQVFRAVALKLQGELALVAGMLKRPELVSSRWALLAELQRLRGGFRRRVGDAVYLTAAMLGPVTREQVVPGHQQEITRAATLRSTATDLVRTVETRLLDTHTPADKRLLALKTDLEVFCTMPAWRYVKAATKREMLKVRAVMETAAGDEPLVSDAADISDVEAMVQPVLDSLREMADQQTHEVLGAHDRAAWSEAGLRLEQAGLHLELDTGTADLAVAAALTAAADLYGRDSHLDALVRKGRGLNLSELPAVELRGLIDQIKQRLSELEVS